MYILLLTNSIYYSIITKLFFKIKGGKNAKKSKKNINSPGDYANSHPSSVDSIAQEIFNY